MPCSNNTASWFILKQQFIIDIHFTTTFFIYVLVENWETKGQWQIVSVVHYILDHESQCYQ